MYCLVVSPGGLRIVNPQQDLRAVPAVVFDQQTEKRCIVSGQSRCRGSGAASVHPLVCRSLSEQDSLCLIIPKYEARDNHHLAGTCKFVEHKDSFP